MRDGAVDREGLGGKEAGRREEARKRKRKTENRTTKHMTGQKGTDESEGTNENR